MLDRAPQDDASTRPRTVAFRGAGFTPNAGSPFRLDRARRGDRAVAIGRQLRLGQSAVPAAAVGDCVSDLQARDVGRALAACFGVGDPDRQRLGTRHDRRGDRRLRYRAVDAGARCRHHLHLGAVPDSGRRAVAAFDLWLGIGEEPKIATIALGVFFSTAISVYKAASMRCRAI